MNNAYLMKLSLQMRKLMDAEMKKYLDVAESVYRNISFKNLSSRGRVDYLNKLLVEIKKEAAIHQLRLMYSNIDFENCLNRPMKERVIKIDLSLLPSLDNKHEYIMWLASFIKSISVSKPQTI